MCKNFLPAIFCNLTVHHPSFGINYMPLIMYSECLASATWWTEFCSSLQHSVACCAVPSVWCSILSSWNFWMHVTDFTAWSIVLEKLVVNQSRISMHLVAFEGLLLHLQKSTSCPGPDPDSVHFNIILPPVPRHGKCFSCVKCKNQNPICMLHALPI